MPIDKINKTQKIVIKVYKMEASRLCNPYAATASTLMQKISIHVEFHRYAFLLQLPECNSLAFLVQFAK